MLEDASVGAAVTMPSIRRHGATIPHHTVTTASWRHMYDAISADVMLLDDAGQHWHGALLLLLCRVDRTRGGETADATAIRREHGAAPTGHRVAPTRAAAGKGNLQGVAGGAEAADEAARVEALQSEEETGLEGVCGLLAGSGHTHTRRLTQ